MTARHKARKRKNDRTHSNRLIFCGNCRATQHECSPEAPCCPWCDAHDKRKDRVKLDYALRTPEETSAPRLGGKRKPRTEWDGEPFPVTTQQLCTCTCPGCDEEEAGDE